MYIGGFFKENSLADFWGAAAALKLVREIRHTVSGSIVGVGTAVDISGGWVTRVGKGVASLINVLVVVTTTGTFVCCVAGSPVPVVGAWVGGGVSLGGATQPDNVADSKRRTTHTADTL